MNCIKGKKSVQEFDWHRSVVISNQITSDYVFAMRSGVQYNISSLNQRLNLGSLSLSLIQRQCRCSGAHRQPARTGKVRVIAILSYPSHNCKQSGSNVYNNTTPPVLMSNLQNLFLLTRRTNDSLHCALDNYSISWSKESETQTFSIISLSSKSVFK